MGKLWAARRGPGRAVQILCMCLPRTRAEDWGVESRSLSLLLLPLHQRVGVSRETFALYQRVSRVIVHPQQLSGRSLGESCFSLTRAAVSDWTLSAS